MRYVMRIARSASHQNFERSLHFPVECVCWSVCGSPTHFIVVKHDKSRRTLSVVNLLTTLNVCEIVSCMIRDKRAIWWVMKRWKYRLSDLYDSLTDISLCFIQFHVLAYIFVCTQFKLEQQKNLSLGSRWEKNRSLPEMAEEA